MQSSFQLKKGSTCQTNDGFSNGSQQHLSTYTQNGSPKNSHTSTGAHTKKRGDSQSNAQQQQQASINLANSLLQFQYPYLPYNQPSASQSQSYYSSGTGVGQQALPSSSCNNAAASGNSRRSGKKKAQASSSQQSEQRVYFNLKKRDQPVCQSKSGSGQGGGHHTQMYKPKIPQSITEWFVKLSPEERVNALTTISQHATDTYINMHYKQEVNGKKYTFADMNNQHEKQSQQQQQQYPCSYSQYSQYVASIFQASTYESLNNPQEQGYVRNEGRPDSYQRPSSSANNSFEENYYCKERTEIEINTITKNDKDRDKIYSEEEILKYVRILDFNQYLDTLSVSQEVVQDPDHFLRLISNATSGKAFQQPCLFKFDGNTQENTIDDPSWFKKRGFYSLSECVIAILEQNLWAHYNYENNQNLGSSKVNDLPALFKDRGESDFSEVSCETLAKFWNQSSPDQKNALLEKLKDNSKALVRSANSNNRGKSKNNNYYSKGGSLRSSEYQANYSISDRSYRGGDSDNHETSFNSISEEQQLIYEIKDIIELANKVGKEQEMIENLSQSPLNRAGKRFDKLCREFLKLLRQKYQEDLVEILLQEEQKSKSNSKWAHNNGKKKKKKNLQQTSSTDKDPAASHEIFVTSTTTITTALSSTTTTTNSTVTSTSRNNNQQDEQVKTKKKKQKKQIFSPQTATDSKKQQSADQLVTGGQVQNSKKRKGAGNSQSKGNNQQHLQQQSEYNKSFDDSLKNKIQTIDNNKKAKDKIVEKEEDNYGATDQDVDVEDDYGEKSTSLQDQTTQQYSGTNSYEILKTQNMDEINFDSHQAQKLQLSISKSVGPDSQNLKGHNNQESKNKIYLHQKQDQLNLTSSKKNAVSTKEYLGIQSNNKSLNMSAGNFLQSEDEILQSMDSSPQRQFSELEELQIKEYVKELAKDMVDKVCLMNENDSQKSLNLAANLEENGKQMLACLQEELPSRKCSFKKKGQPQNYQQEGSGNNIDETANRKASFNKKYSEDYYQRRNTNNKKQSFKNNHYDPQQQLQDDNVKSNAPAHKGSTISESSNNSTIQDKREFNSKQQQQYWNRKEDPQQNKKHQINQKQNNYGNDESVNKKSFQQSNNVKRKEESSDSKSQDNQDQNNNNQDQSAGGNKKKRNRKKGKMNDQDIMNNFVKNLQSNSEDTCTTENDTKSEKNSTGVITNTAATIIPKQQHTGQQKKNSFHNQNNGGQANNSNKQTSSKANTNSNKVVIVNTSNEETKSTISNDKQNNNSQQQTSSSSSSAQYKQKSNQNTNNKQMFQMYNNNSSTNQINNGQKIEDYQNQPQLKHQGLSHQTNTTIPKTNTQKQQRYQQQPQQYRPRGANFNTFHKTSEQDKDQDQDNQSKGGRESFDSLSNQDSKSEKPGISNAQSQPIQSQKLPRKSVNQPQSFKSLNFKNTNDWETASVSAKTDSSLNDNFNSNPATQIITETNPVTTANIKANVHHMVQKLMPSQEDLTFYQQNSQEFNTTDNNSNQHFKNEQMPAQLRDNIYSPQILPTQSNMGHNYSQAFQYNQGGTDELYIPPTIQSPFSCLSTQAQCFTPKDYNQMSQGITNQQQVPQMNTQNHCLGAGYQSFQGTPVKTQKVGFKSSIQSNTNGNDSNAGFQYYPQHNQKHHAPQMHQQYQQQQDQQNMNYMTPPQTSKKSANYSNNYSQGGIGLGQGGEFKKPQKNDVTIKPNQRSPQIQSNQYNQQQQQQQQQQYRHRQSSQEDHSLPQQQHHIAQKQMSLQQQHLQQPFLNNVNSSNSIHQDQIFDYYENEQMRMIPTQIHYPPQQDNTYIYQQQSSPNPTNRYVDPNQNILYQFINSLTVQQQPMMNGGSPLGPNNNNYIQNIQNPHFMPTQLSHQMSQDFHHQNETFNNDNSNQQVGIQVDNNEYLDAESQFYKKLDSDIYEFVDQVKRNLDLLLPERQQVLNQIKQLAQEVYLNQVPRVLVFGSLTTGLALESSDMDLAITDLKIDDRYAMISEMEKLATVIEQWECLESFKFIDTASIPVIKIRVDLKKLREMNLAVIEKQNEIQNMKRDFQARPIRDDQSLLSVDITFDDSTQASAYATNIQAQQYIGGGGLTQQEVVPLNIGSCMVGGQFSQLSQPTSPSFQVNKTHLGLESCFLVQHYIATYPNLKEVAILLKKYLAVHDLNTPYRGGISSYSTVLLIVAYMNYFRRQTLEALSPSQLLMGILDYYGNFFNASTWGINVINEGSYFQQMGTMTLHDSHFMILDPLNLQNNTTRNSYLTSQILRQFQCAFNNLKSLILKNLNLAKNNQTLNIINDKDQVFLSSNYQQQPEKLQNTDQYHSQNMSSPITKEVNQFIKVIGSPLIDIKKNELKGQNMATQEGAQNSMSIMNSITLSDAITNIEVIKRGNFERFLSNIGQNKTLDLGGISDLTVQQQDQRPYESMPFQNNIVSPLTQQQPIFFANINLLETFFAKDTLSQSQEDAAVKGEVNLSLQNENKTTNVSVLANNGGGSKTVKE